MKASELRIGNYVSNPPLSKCRQIDALDIRDQSEHRLIMPFEPIQLTEEWFIKLGFHDRSGTIANRMGYGIDINSMIELAWYVIGDDIRLQSKGSGWTFDTKIRYVHQLQNLYFALTGEELTLTPL